MTNSHAAGASPRSRGRKTTQRPQGRSDPPQVVQPAQQRHVWACTVCGAPSSGAPVFCAGLAK